MTADRLVDPGAIEAALATLMHGTGRADIGRIPLSFPINPGELNSAIRDSVDGGEPVVIAVIADDLGQLERDLMLAAIGLYAREAAPGTRICAVHVLAGAAADDIAAVALFLGKAAAVTGQVIAVGAPR